MNIKKKIFLSVLTNLIVSISFANTKIPTDSLPLDTSIRYGELPNGLTYYIKPLDIPDAGLDLRLLVKAGNFQEGPGESEFAHLVEHIGFKAGRNVTSKKNTNLLNKAGIGIGQINATTNNNFTDYIVQASVENPLVIDVAFNYFHDVLWNLDFTDKNIDLERSTVLGEGDGKNFSQSQFLFLLEKEVTGWGSKPPEDYEDHIKTFKSEKIINFYKKWYRPDLMAIVITGKIDDVDRIEKKIKEKFSKGNRRDDPPQNAVDQTNYLNKAPQFYEQELKDGNDHLVYKSMRLRLYFRQFEIKKVNSNQGLKEQLIKEFFIELLNKKYLQGLGKYNTFLSIRSKFLDPPLALTIDIVPKLGLDVNAFNNVFKTLMEIKRYGFSEEEFNQGKMEYLKSIRKTDTLGISYWKGQIIKHFVNGETLPNHKTKIREKILQDLSKEEFNSEIKKYIQKEPDDITIVRNSDDPALDISEKKIRSWIKESKSLPVTLSVTDEKELVLMDTLEIEKLKEVPIKVFTTEIPGAQSYQMKNGLRVILKSTLPETSGKASDHNAISFRGFSKKGINCFSKKDYFSLINIPSILKNSGVGDLDKFELEKYLERKDFEGYVSPFIESETAGIKGNITLKDLETALQLIYLYFKSPDFNRTAFEDWKTRQYIYMAYKNYPAENFETAIREILPDIDFKPEGHKFIEGLEQTDLKRVSEIYNQIFNDAGNFTFIFTGEFNEEEVLKLCQKYLGSLPAKSNTTKCISKNKDSLIEPIKSSTFYSSVPLKLALVRVAYIKKTNGALLAWKEEIKLELLRRSLGELLMRRMRFESEEGGTYMILALRDHFPYYNYNEVNIDFRAYSKDTERLIEESKNIVHNLKKSPIEISLFEKIKEVLLNEKETNGGTLQKIYGLVEKDIPWLTDEEKKEFIASLSPEDIQATALKYLKNKPIIFKMLPKEFEN